MEDYIVLDIETTGLSKYYHKITEIAAVRVRDEQIIDEFHTLVNPQTPIPAFITRLTGITDEMVRHSPPIHRILPHLLDFLGSRIIVAHNATFDYGFINHNACRYLDTGLDNERLCTRKLANRLIPELASKKLGILCSHFEINHQQAHRAMGDVRATAEVFFRLKDMLSRKGILHAEEILRFQSSKR